jgi:pilus assembly protein CpaC
MRTTSRKPAFHLWGAAPGLATALAALAAAGAFAAALAATVPPALAAEPTHISLGSGMTRSLSLEVNKSTVVDLPGNVDEVIVSQPGVATAIMRTKTRAIVQGVSGGDTNIIFLDARGNNVGVLDIKVVQPRSDVGNALEAAIARNIPGSHISVESVLLGDSTNRVVLSGTALSQDDMQKAQAIAVQFAGSPDNVASIITVDGPQQVMLSVTVAEVQRAAIRQLGLNFSASVSGGLSTGIISNPAMGSVSGANAGSAASFDPQVNGGLVNYSGGTYGAQFDVGPVAVSATLEALERRNAVRTLAQPTLTAMSGQSAEFLAGGQFPYQGTDSNGNPVVQFKDYGVQLSFTPTVKSNGVIGMLVDTTVSEPVSGGALSTRHARTTVELPAGATLAIGGMMLDKLKHEINAFPGLGDIPILGALFRSRDYIDDKTELVILVTPHLARSTTADVQTPVDNFVGASDAEAIFLGRIEKLYGVGSGGMRGSYDGSVGFMLD